MKNEKLVEPLNQLLANHMVYYQKLRHYHWNVRGPAFFQLHDKFEEMYTRVAMHVDLMAERIIGLKGRPISTLQGYLDTSVIKEDHGFPDATAMVNTLVHDIESLISENREVKQMADQTGDDTTVNLLDDIGDAHQDDIWMLRAWLG